MADVASLEDISNVLAEHALHVTATAGSDDQYHSFHLDQLMTIFPSLQDGMDINPKFTNGVSGMEYTLQLTVFEILHIPIFHGWLLDPQDTDMVKLIQNRTYNQLVEVVIAGKDAEAQLDKLRHEITSLQQQLKVLQNLEPCQKGSNSSLNVKSDRDSETLFVSADTIKENLVATTKLLKQLQDQATSGSLIDSFLQSTCHQLTTYGLMELYKHVAPDSLCVFFRNNHFCTMTNHEGVLYLLVTDLGYANVPEIMWEKLDAIDGNTEYMTPSFTKSSLQSDLLPPSSSSPETMLARRAQNNYDLQIAMQLSKGSSKACNYSLSTTTKDSDDDHDLAAAKRASLLNVIETAGNFEDMGEDEAYRLAAQEIQEQLDVPTYEEASIALARQLQEEEYQRADVNRRATAPRRTTPNHQAEKANCLIS